MNSNRLIKAYHDMIKHLHDGFHEAEHSMERSFDIAKSKTRELLGLSDDEAEAVQHYIKRDLGSAPQGSSGNKDTLAEWLKFDIELLENFAIDAFLDVADKTRIEIAKLDLEAHKSGIYTAGEIMGPGTLACRSCKKKTEFKTVNEIAVCSSCGGKKFQRC